MKSFGLLLAFAVVVPISAYFWDKFVDEVSKTANDIKSSLPEVPSFPEISPSNLSSYLSSFSPIKDCSCEKRKCHCCSKLGIAGISANTCWNITILEKETGIDLTVTFNGKEVINEKVSAQNPPPICFDNTHVESIVNACIRLHDLSMKSESFHVCVDFETKTILDLLSESIKVGCTDIPLAL